MFGEKGRELFKSAFDLNATRARASDGGGGGGGGDDDEFTGEQVIGVVQNDSKTRGNSRKHLLSCIVDGTSRNRWRNSSVISNVMV